METPARGGGLRHGFGDAAQIGEGEAFFQDEGGAQSERPRAAHGQIVDGAVHGERADIAAAKEQRLDHEGIGGEGEARAGDLEHRLVFQAGKHGVGESGEEDVAQQLGAELAAAAVAEQHGIPRGQWGAGQTSRIGHADASGPVWRR